MFSYRTWLLGAAIASGLSLRAAPPLTTIQDVLYKADGTRFSGLATIGWQSFDAGSGANIASHVLRVPIVDGNLRVQLVPTTTAGTPVNYLVTYNSDGKIQFSETWSVPPSTLPLRVQDVRMGPGGIVTPPVLTTVQISDVVGLQSELNIRPTVGTGYANSRAAVINGLGALDAAVGNASDCMHVDGTSGACGAGASVAFVDGEVPAGSINGANATFTLANTPNPTSSVAAFRNGLILRPGIDYTAAGASITFQTFFKPQPGDALLASYRLGGSIAGVGFVDAEVPAGNVDGANLQFTLSRPPAPANSLALYRNGVRLKINLDYTLNGAGIAFGAGLAPQPGDTLLCSYRIAQ